MQSNPEGPRDPDDTSGDPSEEQAWREIVEHYGERASIDDTPPEPPTAPPAHPSAPFGGRFGFVTANLPEDDGPEAESDEEERYEPPPPPPIPRTTPDRFAAWLGIFVSPAILLTCLVLSISLPTLIGYGLIASFVGGFVYLVYRMPRGPRDPWDDGAQV